MNSGKEFIKKLLSNKKLIVLFLIGLLMVFMSEKFTDDNVKNIEEKTNLNNYSLDEKELADILGSIKGAGKVEVYITYKNNGEKIVAYDTDKDEKTVVNSGKDNEPYILTVNYPEIKGVLVTASGAWNENVKNRLIKCVKSITDLPYNNICVEIRNK